MSFGNFAVNDLLTANYGTNFYTVSRVLEGLAVDGLIRGDPDPTCLWAVASSRA